MDFKVTTTQEVYVTFRQNNNVDGERIEREALALIAENYPDLRMFADESYFFAYTIKYRSDDGSTVSRDRLESAYNTLVRFGEKEGLKLL